MKITWTTWTLGMFLFLLAAFILPESFDIIYVALISLMILLFALEDIANHVIKAIEKLSETEERFFTVGEDVKYKVEVDEDFPENVIHLRYKDKDKE